MEKPSLVINVLICDDERLECIALQRIFAQSPYPVSILGIAENGLEAVRLVQERSPQLVFMDIRMPGMDGLETARRILEIQPGIQIIILSAYGDFSYAQEALRLGCADYVLKPAEPQTLFSALERARQRIFQLAGPKDSPVLPAADQQPQGNPEPLTGSEDAVANGLVFIRARFQEDLHLEQVATAVSLSPGYFSRIFLQRTGSNFRNYLTWVRIEAAKALLLETTLPVGDIAEKVGYQDANHFSVRFKHETGLSPLLFRRQKGENTSQEIT